MLLTDVLAEIKKLQPIATQEVTPEPVSTLNARRGRKNQAVEKLKTLKREYSRSLLQSAVFIVASGAQREEFTKIATESFGCFSADPQEFYADLAKRVPTVLYLGKSGVSNIFDVLGRHLEDKMGELDINEYNQLLFKSEYATTIATKEQFVDLITRAINKQIGAEIAGIQAIRSLTDTAIEKSHAKSITPVILTTGDEELAQELTRDLQKLTNRVFLTITGKSTRALKSIDEALVLREATEETVAKTMNHIKGNLKK